MDIAEQPARLDTELKRYDIAPDAWEPFLDVWRRMVALRQRLGFDVLFAVIDKERNRFTWAVRHRGDLDAATKAYYDHPDRAELEIVATYLTGYEISRVSSLNIRHPS